MPGTRSCLHGVLMVCAVTALSASVCRGDEVPGEAAVRTSALSAAEAFELGTGADGVRYDAASGGVVLYDAVLVEDDGPGMGGDARWVDEAERSPLVNVEGATQLKKVLNVQRPEATKVMLYVRPGKAIVELNGRTVGTRGSNKFFEVPAGWVRPGANEVIIRAEGDATGGIKLARREHILENAPGLKDRPPRSFRSTDGGKTWQPLDGELAVRLHLVQYAPEGHLTSPVIDLAARDGDPLGLAGVQVRSVRVRHEAVAPEGTGVTFAVRFGDAPVPGAGQWTDWLAVTGSLPKDRRFVQWRATLATSDLRRTPVLKKVVLEADVAAVPAPAWTRAVTLKDFHNETIRYTSMPFEYEDPAHPRMKALREKYKLDEVVKDGKTELEKLVRLRDWVAQQWHFKAPTGHYPDWDADEIMTRKQGICVQYAIAYVQCCIALGYPARYVCGYHPGTMGTAHEVSEVWSNEHRKWVFMDPTRSRNEFCADPKTGEPLSLLEVHDRMVRTYYGDKLPLYENRPRGPQWSDIIALSRGLSTTPTDVHTSAEPAPKSWPSWTKWLLLCYVPRNNFYASPRPLPRLQGWNYWDWTGFWSWDIPGTPRDWRYRHFTSRRSDVLWTINQVRFAAGWGKQPGSLAITMGTVTPNFETFLVRTGGGEWTPSGASTTWKPAPGRNRLEMRVRNTSGVLGPVSFIEVERGE